MIGLRMLALGCAIVLFSVSCTALNQQLNPQLWEPVVDLQGASERKIYDYPHHLYECRGLAERGTAHSSTIGNTVVGALGGAAAGAAIGAAAGNPGKGAAIGGAGGGLAGLGSGVFGSGGEYKKIVRNCLKARHYRVLN